MFVTFDRRNETDFPFWKIHFFPIHAIVLEKVGGEIFELIQIVREVQQTLFFCIERP